MKDDRMAIVAAVLSSEELMKEIITIQSRISVTNDGGSMNSYHAERLMLLGLAVGTVVDGVYGRLS